jgi:hypothetical protein
MTRGGLKGASEFLHCCQRGKSGLLEINSLLSNSQKYWGSKTLGKAGLADNLASDAWESL